MVALLPSWGAGGKGKIGMKCDRDCFNCKYEDCIVDDISQTEREMQKYRDACVTVTGKLPKGHRGKNQGRKGGRYD